MVSNERETGQQAGHVCPACKQPVETVIKRRKILGAFVPVWGPGPCKNPDCPAHTEEPDRTEPEPRR
ncbi:hypothetical protein NLX86_27845 [Streptomyces sp. A3M-1-3]|uniref:hypothetical protein n=1 Tax=Streptomyces sp. A3M-1-3 TaxID=2962044 RepID=UPI0020B66757|nr:hypothetical protein [Streptomyces sp. A3M-1-3]MCP3821767.1 hypothetical protein [Streptomyces sp. A3M-1-3]